MKKITVWYFPAGIRYSTSIFISLGIYLSLIGHGIWLVFSIFLSLLILTTRYITEINIDLKKCSDYVSVLGISFDEEVIIFDRLTKIVVSRQRNSQMLNSRSRSRRLDWSAYTATLIFDDDRQLELVTTNNKLELTNKIEEAKNYFNLKLEDLTSDIQN
jgi:hypothetical protein